MKKCTHFLMVFSTLAVLSVAAAIQIEQQSAAPKGTGIVGEIRDSLNQYNKLSQSVATIGDKLSDPDAGQLWRDYRLTMRGIHCLIDDYRNKMGEFADSARADELFARHIPQIKGALSKLESILTQYAALPKTTIQKSRDTTARDGSWRPRYGRGYDYGRGYGYGRGGNRSMGRGYGYRWNGQEQE